MKNILYFIFLLSFASCTTTNKTTTANEEPKMSVEQAQLFQTTYLTPVFENIEITGFRVEDLDATSPFKKLGIIKGDVIKKINNKVIVTAAALKEETISPSSIKSVDILRNGKSKKLQR